VCAAESKRHLYKLFRWRFLSLQRLSFCWLFLSQQGLCALMNPSITCCSGFVDDFLVGNDLIFIDYFSFNRGCMPWRINVSPEEAVLETICESSATQFSLTISESTEAVCSHESTPHLCKQFHSQFMSRQRLSSPSLFLTQYELCTLTNPSVTCGSSFVDNFWVCRDSVFIDYFWVNRSCVSWQIHVSPVESVSVMIYVFITTSFSLTISESTGVVCDDESKRHLWMFFRWWFLSRQWLNFCWLFLSPHGLCAMMNPRVTCGSDFIDDFLVCNDSVFLFYFWVSKGCMSRQIDASPVVAIPVTIYESAAT
jgi:hypothetical protein